ncbi:uncharacterized protein An02g01820 [Aspergillus niger]|uniref:Contig An02c0030, genomic contig n=2 Tax=Aspergillus niger TaxID=5061 RepID=A2QC03_ASPNC|nr:uncharacterized protein An02g01820 [Aspergillus niger]CAK37484.1 unnamed protein product [Aspergillus niger]
MAVRWAGPEFQKYHVQPVLAGDSPCATLDHGGSNGGHCTGNLADDPCRAVEGSAA